MPLVTLLDARFGWGACPPEILCQIFANLDYKSLVSCMLVHKRWKNAAVDYADCHQLWPQIVAHQMVNKGVTYLRKTNQNCKQILLNSLLWTHLPVVLIEHCRTYEVNEASSMYTYKDKLIVKTKDFVKYYNIPKIIYVAQEKATAALIDHVENEHITAKYERVYVEEDNEECKDLILHGKTHGLKFNSIQTLAEDVILFRLEDDVCYIVTTDFTVFYSKWSSIRFEWDSQLVGRYYGTDTPETLHVYGNTVYMITKSGWLLKSNPAFKSFRKIFLFDVPLNRSPTKWIMFYKVNVVVSLDAPPYSEKIQIIPLKKAQSEHYMVLCDNMSCVTEHGEIIFIGFKSGKVLIAKTKNWLNNERQAALTFHVKYYEPTLKDPTIISLEVFEDQFSHYLCVGTREKILQLSLKYPDHITNYYA